MFCLVLYEILLHVIVYCFKDDIILSYFNQGKKTGTTKITYKYMRFCSLAHFNLKAKTLFIINEIVV